MRTKPYPSKIQSGIYESNTLPTTKNFNRELFRVKAYWPFDFFPDELVIQEKTISVIRREFLFSYVETIPVKDVGRIVLTHSPFFDSITIIGKNPAHTLEIKMLPKGKAKVAKEIIDGLLIEDAGGVDVPYWLYPQTRRDVLRQASRQSQFARK
ncbi:MAG: hypothetical protein NZM26_01360 [Patescibacteria group bacterium]|nr:hypothetical protein [Patescibacteria group bacterium]